MSTVKVGVIGTGHWGKNHLRNFHALGALGALCDANPETAAKFGATYPGVQVFSSYEALFASRSVAAVVIATPAATHGAVTRAALDAGIHVFVEKPLCLDVAEAKGLAAIARRKRLVLMVGHLLLYHPAFRAVQEQVGAGALGTLHYIYSNRLSLGQIRREENALWSFAPHDISMILALTGSLPTSVAATGGNYLDHKVADTTLSHLTFAGGVQAHIFVSWMHPYKEQRLVVVGDRAMLVFDDTRPPGEKLLMYRHQVGWDGDLPVVSRAEAQQVPFGDSEPLRLECQTFLDCIKSGELPPSDAREGIRVLQVLDACQRAIATGARVELTANSRSPA